MNVQKGQNQRKRIEEDRKEKQAYQNNFSKLVLKHYGFYFFVCSAFFFFLIMLFHVDVSFRELIFQSIVYGFSFATILTIWRGGFDWIQLNVLKFILFNLGHIPTFEYRDFLHYANKSSILVESGGLYRFRHDTIRDQLFINSNAEKSVKPYSDSIWDKTLVKILIALIAMLMVVLSFSFFQEDIFRSLYAVKKEIPGYEKYLLGVGDNIESPEGVVPDTIRVQKGDKIQIKARGVIHPGDFLTWVTPKGSQIGLLGLPLFDAYDLDNLDDNLTFCQVVWKVAGEKCWHTSKEDQGMAIKKDGYLIFNVNGRHYQKLKGKFYVTVYLKGAE